MSIDIDEVFVMELEREIKMLERIKSANLDETSKRQIRQRTYDQSNGQPIYAYDNIEYDAMRSPIEVLETVTTHCDALYLSSHYKRNHLHKRKHEFAELFGWRFVVPYQRPLKEEEESRKD